MDPLCLGSIIYNQTVRGRSQNGTPWPRCSYFRRQRYFAFSRNSEFFWDKWVNKPGYYGRNVKFL